MMWADANWMYGLQFTTSNGRFSPHYGMVGGKPAVLSSEDGVLVAFSGIIKSGTFHPLQVSSVY